MQSVCFLTAIHQRRHALLHLDPDEWQWERWREWTNPHPRLPQDCSDPALHEPHCQHGTGCIRHVTVPCPCWLRCIGRVGQKKRAKTQKRPQITWLSGLTRLFSWLSTRPTRLRFNFIAQVHAEKAPYKLGRDFF